MKIKMLVRDTVTGAEWWESTIQDGKDPMACAQAVAKQFNATLQPGEHPREIVKAESVDDTINQHDWEKTNLVTTRDEKGRLCDKYKCRRCGITGNIYVLGGDVARDARYKKNEFCTGKSQYPPRYPRGIHTDIEEPGCDGPSEAEGL